MPMLAMARRGVVAGLVGACLLTIATIPLAAQDAPKPVQRKSNPARRVPAYFSKVGLTPEQRESVYKIRGTYQPKIAELKQQIIETQAKEMAECESVLTESQKKLLEQFRAERGGGAARRGNDPDKPALKPAE
jgi:Spy/CpxP family protein refolding chaperone